MIPVLPNTVSSPTQFPASAALLPAQAIYQLGRVATAYENRAWAREKVKLSKQHLNTVLSHTDNEDDLSVKLAKAQFADREQVLVSHERFYKKLRFVINDNYPDALPCMEEMIPGSTKGLTNAPTHSISSASPSM